MKIGKTEEELPQTPSTGLRHLSFKEEGAGKRCSECSERQDSVFCLVLERTRINTNCHSTENFTKESGFCSVLKRKGKLGIGCGVTDRSIDVSWDRQGLCEPNGQAVVVGH